MSANPLRLFAEDSEDLAILSAHMQDAVVRVGDMAYLARERRFALVGARFDWVAAETGRIERSRTGMHFDGIVSVVFRGFDPYIQDAALNLLSIEFSPDDPPGGAVFLKFSGEASVKLTVECIDAQLRDLGERWQTTAKPGHADET